MAITYYSTGSNKVDIINISFGFPRFDERLRPVLEAIRVARNNNVVLFAAAGNEGGKQGVYWPASLHDAGDVIRINSSDSEGNASGFNPDIGVGRRICTLGEGVPTGIKNTYRSGTSFATPIAAAIAAIVLGFMDNINSATLPEDFDQLKPRLRTRLGIEKVLCETHVLQFTGRRSGFSYITPWHFLRIEKQSRIHSILNILRGGTRVK